MFHLIVLLFICLVLYLIFDSYDAADTTVEEAREAMIQQEARRKQYALLLQPVPGSGVHQTSTVVEKQFSPKEQACEKEKAAQRQHRALFLQPEPGSGVHRPRK